MTKIDILPQIQEKTIKSRTKDKDIAPFQHLQVDREMFLLLLLEVLSQVLSIQTNIVAPASVKLNGVFTIFIKIPRIKGISHGSPVNLNKVPIFGFVNLHMFAENVDNI